MDHSLSVIFAADSLCALCVFTKLYHQARVYQHLRHSVDAHVEPPGEIDRIEHPSQIIERIWTRLASGRLFMHRVSEHLCLSLSINVHC